MWGYYTNNGGGMCIVLDVAKTELCPVQYVSRRTEFSSRSSFPLPDNPDFRQFSSTKSNHWLHEREQRFFVDLEAKGTNLCQKDGRNFIKFGDKIKLAGIINGPRPEVTGDDILSASGEEVSFFQCRPAFRDFRMVMQQDQRLWN